ERHGNGKVSVNVSGTDQSQDVQIDGNGRILVCGSDASTADFAVMRLNPADGTLDTTFNSTGKQTVDFGNASGEVAYAMTVQADGRIVLAGSGGSGLAVAR